MLIRRAGIDDVEQLRLLYQELEEDGVRYQPEHFVVGERSNEFFQSVFESADQDILVAEEDGKILGFSHVMILEQKKVACLKPGNISLYTGSGCIGIKAESGNRNSSYGGKQAVRKRTRGRFYQDTGISAEYRWNEIL